MNKTPPSTATSPPNRTDAVTRPGRAAKLFSQTLALLGMALLPKCPACLAAYVGILTTLGVGMATVLAWSSRILIALCGIVLWQLLRLALQTGKFAPVSLGVLGFAAMVTAQFQTESAVLRWGGLALFWTGCALAFVSGRNAAGARPAMATDPS